MQVKEGWGSGRVPRAIEKGHGRWEALLLNGFRGLPGGGSFKGLGFGTESKLGPRLSARQALEASRLLRLLPLPATDNAPGCMG